MGDVVCGGLLNIVEAQKSLVSWRQFTSTQKLLIADQMFSSLTIDANTAIGVRPLELLFIKRASDYIHWFCRKRHNVDKKVVVDGEERKLSTTEQMVSDDLNCSAWVYGMDCQVIVCYPALQEIIESSYSIRNEMCCLLAKVYDYASCCDVHSVKVSNMVHLFVDESYSCRFVPLVVYSGVKLSQAQQFFVNILVSMGTFDCEYDLYQGRCVSDFSSMRVCYQKDRQKSILFLKMMLTRF